MKIMLHSIMRRGRARPETLPRPPAFGARVHAVKPSPLKPQIRVPLKKSDILIFMRGFEPNISLCGKLTVHQWEIHRRVVDVAWWREFNFLINSAELYDAAVDKGPVENF